MYKPSFYTLLSILIQHSVWVSARLSICEVDCSFSDSFLLYNYLSYFCPLSSGSTPSQWWSGWGGEEADADTTGVCLTESVGDHPVLFLHCHL